MSNLLKSFKAITVALLLTILPSIDTFSDSSAGPTFSPPESVEEKKTKDKLELDKAQDKLDTTKKEAAKAKTDEKNPSP